MCRHLACLCHASPAGGAFAVRALTQSCIPPLEHYGITISSTHSSAGPGTPNRSSHQHLSEAGSTARVSVGKHDSSVAILVQGLCSVFLTPVLPASCFLASQAGQIAFNEMLTPRGCAVVPLFCWELGSIAVTSAVGQAGLAASPHSYAPQSSLCRPDGLMYQMFRNQFLSFSMYQSKCCRACWARTCLQHPGVLPSSAAENWLWMLTAHGLFSWLFSHPLPPRGQEELCAKAARSWAGAEPAGRYLLPSSPLSLQASCSSSSTTTRAGACTGSEHWARGTTWTSLWVSQDPGPAGRAVTSAPASSPPTRAWLVLG